MILPDFFACNFTLFFVKAIRNQSSVKNLGIIVSMHMMLLLVIY